MTPEEKKIRILRSLVIKQLLLIITAVLLKESGLPGTPNNREWTQNILNVIFGFKIFSIGFEFLLKYFYIDAGTSSFIILLSNVCSA